MKINPTFEIDGRTIGADKEPYVICELSGNHNGSLEKALHMIEVAARSGCDAIKIQSYTPDTITIDSDKPEFRLKGGLWDGKSLYELYKEAHTPFEWHDALFSHARKLGVTIFSSPFDKTAVDLLEGLGAPAYKVASFEMIDLPLIDYIATKNKPMIISTGMANAVEIDEALSIVRKRGNDKIVLLHCVSNYPTSIDDANLRTIPLMLERFGCPVGLSDHTLGTAASVAAIALGACVIEKHFTLSRSDGGSDAAFSLEPPEFSQLVNDCRLAHSALGHAQLQTLPSETGSKQFRRSLYVVADIKKGDPLTEFNVRSIRPGLGMPPKKWWDVIGKFAARDLFRGEPLHMDMIYGSGDLND